MQKIRLLITKLIASFLGIRKMISKSLQYSRKTESIAVIQTKNQAYPPR